jgi:hypothetical protein
MIREVFAVDEIPERSHYAVLSLGGTYTPASRVSAANLVGEVYLAPYEVQGELCVMEAWFRTGFDSGNGYEWGTQSSAYWNWVHDQGDDCEISGRSDVPQNAVVTNEPVPSAALKYVLVNAGELLTLYFDQVAREPEIDESLKERFLNYRNDESYRLDRLRITPQSVPDTGFAYSATFRAFERSEGPSVTFSITRTGFVVHSVGFWIA